METRGNIEEIFDSVQGEGPFVGCRQLFVRLGGCNRACQYCDSPQARRPAATCRVETATCSGRYDYMPNSLSVNDVIQVVSRLWLPGHHSVSITGGEPLVQAGFLRSLLPALVSDGHKVYLDTNSTLPGELNQIVEHCGFVAADIKISSCTGEPNRFDDHLEFLRKCVGPQLFAKIIVTETVDPEEFIEAVRLVLDSGRLIPLVIQPATSRRGDIGIGSDFILELQRKAIEIYSDVRIIPQIHQMLRLA